MMVAYREGNQRNTRDKQRSQKMVALVRRVNKITGTTENNEILNNDDRDTLDSASKKNYFMEVETRDSSYLERTNLVRRNTDDDDNKKRHRNSLLLRIPKSYFSKEDWKSQYELIQEQQEATRMTADILQSCITRITNSGRHGRPRPMATTFNNNKNNNNNDNKSQKINVTGGNNQQSKDDTSHKDRNKIKKQIKAHPAFNDQGYLTKKKKTDMTDHYPKPYSSKKVRFDNNPEIGPRKSTIGPSNKDIPKYTSLSIKKKTVQSNVYRQQQISSKTPQTTITDTAANTTIDMKGLYRRAFQVRCAVITKERRRRRAQAVMRIQDWWRRHGRVKITTKLSASKDKTIKKTAMEKTTVAVQGNNDNIGSGSEKRCLSSCSEPIVLQRRNDDVISVFAYFSSWRTLFCFLLFGTISILVALTIALLSWKVIKY